MRSFILRRAGAAVIVLFLSSVLIFVGVRALPGDPALALAGEEPRPGGAAAIREKYGLDKPVPVQYVTWRQPRRPRRPRASRARAGCRCWTRSSTALPVTIELALLACWSRSRWGSPPASSPRRGPGSAFDYGGQRARAGRAVGARTSGSG